MNYNMSLQPNDYYKNWNKHANCYKCKTVLSQEYYKKRRTVCKLCYNNHVPRYIKNKFFSKSSPKSDASTQTDFCNKEDS